jgi:Icc-related predicted phosphoesterase
MKINLISDCHINFEDLVLPGGDVLIMAGDIMEAGHLRQADNAKKNTFIADRYRRFCNEELIKYRKVLYVCGNHEHYNNSYDDTHDRLAKELPDNVHFLEAEGVQIEDVHFFGGTFWTCMNKGDPISMSVLKQSMADFSGAIKFGTGVRIDTLYGDSYWTNKFTPQYAKGVFHETVEKLKQFVEARPNEKIVVVSHHAPSPQSVAPHYKQDFHMNGGYHSYLDEFIMDHPQIKYWFHGHMHDPVDYMIGSTRVLSNPRGYKGYEPQADVFDPGFTVEI